MLAGWDVTTSLCVTREARRRSRRGRGAHGPRGAGVAGDEARDATAFGVWALPLLWYEGGHRCAVERFITLSWRRCATRPRSPVRKQIIFEETVTKTKGTNKSLNIEKRFRSAESGRRKKKGLNYDLRAPADRSPRRHSLQPKWNQYIYIKYSIDYSKLCERVEHVGPLGRAEKSRTDQSVSPDRVTRALYCNAIARNNFNVPKEVSLQKCVP
ncbi:hypothetical protein EVAR_87800_1 [Eumeta japonica]|uniref:Uncharacterized protein n=1 Tax=Eumeta variegata TaxID=151549 RepID=A0A4C1X5D6_EUMVA|nr:hypothetical protein EVAR_87800_1 [Eumeta japonica]